MSEQRDVRAEAEHNGSANPAQSAEGAVTGAGSGTGKVGLVLVSHSAKLAEGLRDVAEQMASDVAIVAAGGSADGGIGTDAFAILKAIEAADSGAGVVVLTDLGSAVMSTEMALEMLSADVRGSVLTPVAPFVEGAVAAAVDAQGGADVRQVAQVAQEALAAVGGNVGAAAASSQMRNSEAATGGTEAGSNASGNAANQKDSVGVSGTFELVNPMGLHARPAAEIAGKMQELDVQATINDVDAASVMLLMTLGLGKGALVNFKASGPDAEQAGEWLEEQVNNGFGEL